MNPFGVVRLVPYRLSARNRLDSSRSPRSSVSRRRCPISTSLWFWSAPRASWGEAVGLTRANIDVLRSRIIVESTAIEVHGKATLGQEPKTWRSKRTIPVARSVMRRLEKYLADHVGLESDASVFTARRGGPLFRSTFAGGAAAGCRTCGPRWLHLSRSSAQLRGPPGGRWPQRSRGLRVGRPHSVAFKLTRYGGLFDDGSNQAVDRLYALMHGSRAAVRWSSSGGTEGDVCPGCPRRGRFGSGRPAP